MTNEPELSRDSTDNGGHRAVFMSYASEDTDAAARICASLRAAGIEVWFDQSELRSGDAWDQKIRREIRDCLLFVPLISRNTEARTEGYFRLEWHLADQRTQLMAKSRPFLVPVCIDDTPEAKAEVPDSFTKIQWTRLPAGDTPPTFVSRVAELLTTGAPATETLAQPLPVSAAAAGGVDAASPRAPPAAGPRRLLRRKNAAWLVVAGVAVIAGVYLAIGRFSPREHVPAAPSAPIVAPPSQAIGGPAVPDRSVAVLPFVDMSERKDQEYFSDGLADELINMLAQVRELRVPARTSSFYFKGKSVDVPTIASRLLVAHVLEGSVRRAGNRMRITAQLIRADTGYHVWSNTYERKFEDIFKVQDEIAAAVVKALKVSLLGGAAPHTPATKATDAYTLLLQARAADDLDQSIRLIRQALRLDLNYAPSWAALAGALIGRPFQKTGAAACPEIRAEALEAAQRAVRLDPELSAAHVGIGLIRFRCDWDWAGAEAEFRRSIQLNPSNATALIWAGFVAATRGRLNEAAQLYAQARAVDPLGRTLFTVAWRYFAIGRFEAAEDAVRRFIELDPTAGGYWLYGATLVALGKGDAGVAEIARDEPDEDRDLGFAWAYQKLGRRDAAAAALADYESKYGAIRPYFMAVLYALSGDRERAFQWLDRAYQQRDVRLPMVGSSPDFETLRSDPRYAALVKKMRLNI